MGASSHHQQAGRIGGLKSWANTSDPTARTAPGREAFRASFLTQVDPHGLLSDEERQRRADYAFRAHMAGLALKSKSARAARKSSPAESPNDRYKDRYKAIRSPVAGCADCLECGAIVRDRAVHDEWHRWLAIVDRLQPSRRPLRVLITEP